MELILEFKWRFRHSKLILVYLVVLQVLLYLVGIGFVQAEEIIITIPARVEINQSWITLGEIARIEGLEGDKLKEVRALILGKALLPGYSREIPREQIILIMENHGFDRSAIKLVMPAAVVVKTASRTLNSQEIIKGASEFIQGRLNYSPELIKIEPVFIPPDIVIPDQDYQLVFQTSITKELLGKVSILVQVVINQQEYKRIFLSFQVEAMGEVYVALRTINKGETIQKKDFKRETRGIAELRGEVITNFNNNLIRHGEVSLPLKQGNILTSYYLIIPDIIRVGDELRAEIIAGSITVATNVKACQNGKYGEYILVENTKTGHRFKAQVINDQLVRYIQQ